MNADSEFRDCRAAADTIIARIRKMMIGRDTPILVAIDGGSGAGKSTVALMIAEELNAALVQSDDFFAADITDAGWDSRTPEAKALDVFDWWRLRAEALEPLLRAQPAKWHAFDFQTGTRLDGTYPMRTDFVKREPRAVIVLEGTYSCRPELSDTIDLSVLIDVPVHVRHQRFAARCKDENFRDSWHARWDAAEQYYFTHVRPRSSFDLVAVNGA